MLAITWNVDTVLRDLDREAKQTKFALSRTLNFVAEAKQREMGQQALNVLNVRSARARRELPRVILFGRNDRSDHKVGKFEATLRVIGRGEAAQTDLKRTFSAILLRQDDAGTQTSGALYRGQNNQLIVGGFYLPAPGLRTETKAIPKNLYPSSIGVSMRRAIDGGFTFARQFKRSRRKKDGTRTSPTYFFVKAGVGIFKREQRSTTYRQKQGASAIRMSSARRGYEDKGSAYDSVWFFRTRITIPKRVDLEGTFQRGLNEQFNTTFARFYEQALETAR